MEEIIEFSELGEFIEQPSEPIPLDESETGNCGYECG